MTGNEEMMYGMSVDDMREQFGWMIDTMGHRMTAISVLSDAQEVMARDPERARKYVNIAKFILIETMRQQKVAA